MTFTWAAAFAAAERGVQDTANTANASGVDGSSIFSTAKSVMVGPTLDRVDRKITDTFKELKRGVLPATLEQEFRSQACDIILLRDQLGAIVQNMNPIRAVWYSGRALLIEGRSDKLYGDRTSNRYEAHADGYMDYPGIDTQSLHEEWVGVARREGDHIEAVLLPLARTEAPQIEVSSEESMPSETSQEGEVIAMQEITSTCTEGTNILRCSLWPTPMTSELSSQQRTTKSRPPVLRYALVLYP
ncbi:hypothetical protein BD311DRAFT_101737 [Dichomitus squalens]|uniref:Uncharacterized protein n=1 Tax=Dichomitus squalens TaxID=114155 RepID=A0A4Q9MUP1_9APHY|nr:hypothetical protein BD311DRAFT_101737 [Dichomitus squalens]